MTRRMGTPVHDHSRPGAGGTVVTARDELGLPTVADTANADQSLGQMVYVDGTDTQSEGLWIHMGDVDGYVQFPPETQDESVDFKVIHGQVFAGNDDFASLQEALDFANNNGYDTILVPPGNYGPVVPYSDQFVWGLSGMRGNASIDGGTTGHAIDGSQATSGNMHIMNLSLKTTSGAGNAYDCINFGSNHNNVVQNCSFNGCDRHAIYANGNDLIIRDCYFAAPDIDNDSLHFDSNTIRCSATDNSRVGTVTDVGTSNLITDNT